MNSKKYNGKLVAKTKDGKWGIRESGQAKTMGTHILFEINIPDESSSNTLNGSYSDCVKKLTEKGYPEKELIILP